MPLVKIVEQRVLLHLIKQSKIPRISSGFKSQSVWVRLDLYDGEGFTLSLPDLHQAPTDNMEKRVDMYEGFSQKINNNEEYFNDVWFSDKAHFLSNGHVKVWFGFFA